ncbi:nitroreductase [Sphingorhabdus sp. EL138]|uniref:nitroreductase family protein n=1 Tax=Sphingorhabdus sp. EL138 TaxID=2073156 RepID=UPI000D693FFA|nr:nitroreductase [Sphingorhabdus sp. EL138]
MFNDLSSLNSYLSSRRSGRPRNMIAPGPSDEQIEDIVATALRTPDHGKLAPWRVIRIDSDQRSLLAAELAKAYQSDKPDAGRLELEALETMAHQAPALLVVLFSPVTSTKIPLWEQELSCGAFSMNVIHAIHAHGFVGGWITGWPTYNDDVRDLFGKAPERIAGFIFAGTADGALAERPRPELDAVLSRWTGTQSG